MSKFLKCLLVLFVSLLCIGSYAQEKSKFRVVLDAGHGGKDDGTTHNGYVEKDIVLDVILKVGKLLAADPAIAVTYTRKTDVFIELRERAHIANRANADLFISIHCNGHKTGAASGTETFVMGLARNKTNLEVAKKENNVIMLEADYKVKYKGFDPNAPETLIGLTVMQEANMDQSIMLANQIDNNFKHKLNRNSRGVKQAPLWVLDATVMPGTLIELGFLSNKEEGRYVNSEAGKNELAKAIAQAVVDYKKIYFGGKAIEIEDFTTAPKTDAPATDKKKAMVEDTQPAVNAVVFKVKIATSNRDLQTTPSNFKKLKGISRVKAGNAYEYYYGNESSYDGCRDLLSEAKAKGYSSAFIVPFRDGKKITIEEALK
jgi:N-acetylmuramoyl-L-alanine amidase